MVALCRAKLFCHCNTAPEVPTEVTNNELGAAGGALACTRTEWLPGAHVVPPSLLNSMNTSKKLLTRNPRGSGAMVCVPSVASVGLSRNRKVPIDPVTELLNCSILVEKLVVLPMVPVLLIVKLSGPPDGLPSEKKFAPSALS